MPLEGKPGKQSDQLLDFLSDVIAERDSFEHRIDKAVSIIDAIPDTSPCRALVDRIEKVLVD